MTDKLPYAHLEKHNAAFLRVNVMLSAAGLVRGMLNSSFRMGWAETREGCWPPAGWAAHIHPRA